MMMTGGLLDYPGALGIYRNQIIGQVAPREVMMMMIILRLDGAAIQPGHSDKCTRVVLQAWVKRCEDGFK